MFKIRLSSFEYGPSYLQLRIHLEVMCFYMCFFRGPQSVVNKISRETSKTSMKNTPQHTGYFWLEDELQDARWRVKQEFGGLQDRSVWDLRFWPWFFWNNLTLPKSPTVYEMLAKHYERQLKRPKDILFSQRKIRCVMNLWLITLGPHRMIGLFANMAPRNGRLDGHDEAMARDGRDFLVGKNVIQWA